MWLWTIVSTSARIAERKREYKSLLSAVAFAVPPISLRLPPPLSTLPSAAAAVSATCDEVVGIREGPTNNGASSESGGAGIVTSTVSGRRYSTSSSSSSFVSPTPPRRGPTADGPLPPAPPPRTAAAIVSEIELRAVVRAQLTKLGVARR